jgi:hypothetical protein
LGAEIKKRTFWLQIVVCLCVFWFGVFLVLIKIFGVAVDRFDRNKPFGLQIVIFFSFAVDLRGPSRFRVGPWFAKSFSFVIGFSRNLV